MHPIITLVPPTRINDSFDHRGIINAGPVNDNIYHPVVKGLPNDPTYRYQADFYQQVACDIVVETVFDYPYPYVTEKTLRSIACKRMFILIAPAGCLALLKQIGFETFNDIIDESYDSVTDPFDRYNSVIDSVQKFCEIPLQEIKTYMKQNSNKFEHNFHHLVDLEQRQLSDLSKKINLF